MIQPRLVWELARKDLLLFATDRRGMLLCFGVPVLLAAIFGAIFHRPDNSEVLCPNVCVVASGKAPFLSRVSEKLRACPRLRVTLCDLPTAHRRMAAESGTLIVILPQELAKLSLTRSEVTPSIRLIHHPGCVWESRWVEGVVTEIVLREAASDLLGPLGVSLPSEPPFRFERRSEPACGALSSHAYSHSFCGMTLQYLLFWGMDSGLLLLRERRAGIWRRLRAAPISQLTLLLGKALATALIALCQIFITFSVGIVVFGVTISGSPLGFVLMALAAALLSSATGLLVAALGGNETRARSVAILVILTLSLLGGLWLPAFLLPNWVQKLAIALPTTWAARGLEGVTWQGMDWTGAVVCALVLLGFSLAFLLVAWWRLARADGFMPRPGPLPT
jgi:ABC-2 type transport system permease protein